jgi:hypothetical protein
MSQTLPRMDVATAMLIAIDDKLFSACVSLLDDAGFRVIRVKHVAAASERLPVVMPHLVIASTSLVPAEIDVLSDRCVAIGAELLALSAEVDTRLLGPLLASAAERALQRRR